MLRAEIGSHIVLRDISDIEENQIEKELTFSNHKYEKIMNFGKLLTRIYFFLFILIEERLLNLQIQNLS